MESINWLPIIFYYVPSFQQTQQSACIQAEKEICEEQKNQNKSIISMEQQQRWNTYLEIFKKELVKNMEKFQKKKWEKSQDHLLIKLRQNGLNWVQISKMIQKTNPQICKRRYIRIVQNEKKWPKVVDELIKRLYEQQGKKWPQIYSIVLELCQQQFSKYNIKKIKQRYFLHLRTGIQQRQWSIQQDVNLLNLIKQKGKKWKDLTTQFQGRTELQLKNRYNGTLKLMEKRVIRKLNSYMKLKNKQKF